MRKNIIYSLFLSWMICFGISAQSTRLNQSTLLELLEKHPAGFANLEHRTLGNQVQLRFISPVDDPKKPLLHLPNGLALSYGEIMMLGGDFFGNPSYPVSSCMPGAQKKCFMAQFDSLGRVGKLTDTNCNSPVIKARTINQYLDDLNLEIKHAKSHGVSEEKYYEEHAGEISKKLNRLTCGGSFISDYLPFGDFLKLAAVNFDHFMPDSIIAYKAGHAVALDTAMKAHRELTKNNNKQAQKLLELAYAQNAFANHYLSDSFSSGHLRTPRRVIHNKVILPAILKLLLANLMHDEDNKLGLMVVNKEHISFMAYGDGYSSKAEASTQVFVIQEALQRSADALFQTFMTGQRPADYSELNLLPDLEQIDQLNQTAPLFKTENGQLLRRKNRHDPYDQEWTSLWNGLLTLLE